MNETYQSKNWKYGEWDCEVAYDVCHEMYRGFATINPAGVSEGDPPQCPFIQISSREFDAAVSQLEENVARLGDEAKAACKT